MGRTGLFVVLVCALSFSSLTVADITIEDDFEDEFGEEFDEEF